MKKIAIIGSGISGMTAAHLLAKEPNEIHLFESGERLGGHTATVDVETSSGKYAIDTGFIVFNDWTYPNFIQLLNELGVTWRDTLMSFSVKTEREGLEYNGKDLNHLFAQRRNLLRPSFYRMLLEIVRFNRESLTLLESEDEGITLGAYLKAHGYGPQFMEHYIVPMGAAIWSSSVKQMQEFPARFFVQFFKNHGMLSVENRPTWRTVTGGSRAYIEPLVRSVQSNIHLGSPVLGVRRFANHATVEIGGANPRTENFDQVVFACHAPEVRSILKDPSPLEKDILGAFEYQPNETILHTDESILPKTRNTWAAWNYFVPKQASDRVAVSYDMNILQGVQAPETFVVSLNLGDRINPLKVLRRFSYDHPIFTLATTAAQGRWLEISRLETRTHFCGAYWGYGFHEDGVKSAVKVARTFGVDWGKL